MVNFYTSSDAMVRLFHGNARQLPLEDASVQTCATSPPYWGHRDYNVDGQIGLEPTPDEYVASLVEVFREVRRVLKDDGTLWLNLGDSYANDGKFGGETGGKQSYLSDNDQKRVGRERRFTGLKPKDLVGIPWLVAFALRADGWYLRSDIIWAKPNAMPESVTDRPTKAHEYIFLLSKSAKYFYDAEAIKVDGSGVSGGAAFGKVKQDGPGARRISAEDNARIRGTDKQRGHSRRHAGFNDRWNAMERAEQIGAKVNRRDIWTVDEDEYAQFIQWKAERTGDKSDVWTVCPANYHGAHFATFPPALIEPCIFAGSRRGDTVLDPFNGSGTTGAVARKHGRNYVGVDLNLDYLKLSHDRFAGELFRLFNVNGDDACPTNTKESSLW